MSSLTSLPARLLGRCRSQWFRWRHPSIRIGRPFAVHGTLIVRGPGAVRVGDAVTFDNATGRPNRLLTFDPGATVNIGSHCYINGVEIACQHCISIGDQCIIAECRIMDTDFHSTEVDRSGPGAVVKAAAVTIGRNVWIANKTIILRGVGIGDNSVVGAGAVVTRDVPPNVVVAGNPARVNKAFSVPQADPGPLYRDSL